jgi:hypothetical protein
MFLGAYIGPSISSFQEASVANQRFHKRLAAAPQQFCTDTVNIFLMSFLCRRRENEL